MKLTRKELINTLIDEAFSSDMPSDDILEECLRIGCKGYNNMTNEELLSIYNNGLDEDEIAIIKE